MSALSRAAREFDAHEAQLEIGETRMRTRGEEERMRVSMESKRVDKLTWSWNRPTSRRVVKWGRYTVVSFVTA